MQASPDKPEAENMNTSRGYDDTRPLNLAIQPFMLAENDLRTLVVLFVPSFVWICKMNELHKIL